MRKMRAEESTDYQMSFIVTQDSEESGGQLTKLRCLLFGRSSALAWSLKFPNFWGVPLKTHASGPRLELSRIPRIYLEGP